jgi:hypothetical protein
MARSTLTDHLQVYPFWLTDVAPIEPLALPIFSPLSGFSAITAPEMTIDTYEVKEANWYFNKKVVQSASVASITLSRAAKWFDSDFYSWILTALTGDSGGQPLAIDSSNPGPPSLGQAFQRGGPTPRRDLLLIQFLSRTPFPEEVSPTLAAAAQAALVLTVQGVSSALGGGAAGVAGAAAGAGVAGALGAGNVGFGLVEFTPRFPAKAWMLYGCIPTRYKVGGDFDASSSDVSIQELEIEYDYFDEISLAIP